MPMQRSIRVVKTIHVAVAAVIVEGALIISSLPTTRATAAPLVSETKGPFQFEPLLTFAPCTPGGNASLPLSGTTLFVHAQHRGGDGLDKSLAAITKN